jgi:transcriptional regulator with XRE-family HTH domain
MLMTSRELAERAGCSPVTIWRIEAGRESAPQVKTMRRIADALGVQPGEIAEFTD